MSSRNFNLAQAPNIGVTVLPDLTALPTVNQALVVRQLTAGNVETGFVTLAGGAAGWTASPVAATGPSLQNTSGTLDVANTIVTTNINGLAAAPGSGLGGGNITIMGGAGDSAGPGNVTIAVPGGAGGYFLSQAHTQIGDFNGGRFFSLTAPVGNRAIRWQTATNATTFVNRWQLFTNATAEAGSNAGSDLDLWNFNDAGGVINNPVLRITRATGVAAFAGPISAPFHATGVGNINMSGTTQATARAVATGVGIIIGGSSLSANGVVLPPIGAATVVGAVPVGTKVDIFNTVTFTAHVYANGTQVIDAAPAATGVSLSAGARCSYFANTGSTWVSALMGTASA